MAFKACCESDKEGLSDGGSALPEGWWSEVVLESRVSSLAKDAVEFPTPASGFDDDFCCMNLTR